MGGAQPLAITMNEGVGLIVEVDEQRALRRQRQGFLDEIAADLDDAVARELESEARGAKLPLVARFDAASRVRADQSVEVVVDTARIHVFDLDTGAAVGGHPVGAEV
jgi:urocanate hydratase